MSAHAPPRPPTPLAPPTNPEHWRDNAAALAAQGFEVYCPTLPGYGRAEKPALPYGQVSVGVGGGGQLGGWVRAEKPALPYGQVSVGVGWGGQLGGWVRAEKPALP